MAKATIRNRSELMALFTGISQHDEYPINISYSHGKNRSVNQNALFWMWMTDLSRFLISHGRKESTPDFCHDLMCNTFLGVEYYNRVNAITGESLEEVKIKGTSKLTKGEFTRFLDQIYHKCLDWGLTLKIPADCEFQRLMEEQDK